MRVDFFRGLALWWIFTDHIPDNWINQLSLRNFAICDSAEVFVFLAGFGAGLAYGRSMDRNGWLYAAADCAKRAWTLYVAHIFLFVVFAAQVSYSATALDRTDYLDEIHLDVLGEEPYRAMLEALWLHFQPAYLDILPMYIVLLVAFAAAMPLLRWPYVLAGLSFGVYAGARLFQVNLPSFTGDGWYFNPLAWQLLFTLGAIMAYVPGEHPGRLATRTLDVLSGLTILFGLVLHYGVWDHPWVAAYLPQEIDRVLLSVDKGGLHPFRLISILSLVWAVYRLVAPESRWLSSRWAAPFILCGQHSLPVFCSGIFLSFLGRLFMEEEGGVWVQVVVNAAGGIVLVGIGALSAYYSEKGRRIAQPLVGGALP